MSGDHAAQRRDVARRLHPDRGGDPAAFVRAMAELDARPAPTGVAPPSTAAAPVTVHVPRRRRVSGTARRGARRLALRLRRTLPRQVPGSRRYGHL